MRSMKYFNSENFLNDLNHQPWANVYSTGDPNDMWQIWMSLLKKSIDKHAPRRIKEGWKKEISLGYKRVKAPNI